MTHAALRPRPPSVSMRPSDPTCGATEKPIGAPQHAPTLFMREPAGTTVPILEKRLDSAPRTMASSPGQPDTGRVGACCGRDGYQATFSDRFAHRMGRRFRKHGLTRTQERLIGFLAERGIEGATA